MISGLRGTLAAIDPLGESGAEVMVDVGGVGYEVTVGARCAASLPSVGREIELAIYTHVREGAISLFGFTDREERRIFSLVITAHGVGPALGLAILGVLSPSALSRAVTTADHDALTVVPGVGKKTAQRLVIDLAERLGSIDDDPSARRNAGRPRVTVICARPSLRSATDPRTSGPRSGGSPKMGRSKSASVWRCASWRRRRGDGDTAAGARSARGRPGRPGRGAQRRPRPRSPSRSGLRPRKLEEFVGQGALKEHLAIVLEAARRREQPVDHLLFAGPPGLGKTTLAGIVAVEMGSGFRVTSGPALARGGDLAAILTGLLPGDVLFIDEIHRLNRVVEEILYPAMEDFQIDIVIGKGPTARSVRLELPRFTLVGATTRTGLVTGPLRDRFGFVARLELYEEHELEAIVERTGRLLGVSCTADGAREIARRSRGTPRLAIRLLRRVRDFVEVRREGMITVESAIEGSTLFGIDELGLDRLDRQLLEILCVRFSGRPVGLSTLSVSVGEDPETIEDVYEPYLLQKGLIQRTPRGRVATPAAYLHLGLPEPIASVSPLEPPETPSLFSA